MMNLSGKRVVIRVDLNVPLREDGSIANDQRIRAVLPTLEQALAQGARVVLLSHLGRPVAGQFEERYSLKPIADHLSGLLDKPVRFCPTWPDEVPDLEDGELAMAENVRFFEGETQNDASLAKRMAANCDVFIMDAFATIHREHASTYGIAEHVNTAMVGPLVRQELEALDRALDADSKGVLAIVAGSKVSTKVHLLRSLIERVAVLFVGGGIANTWLAAQGVEVGKSLKEDSAYDEVHTLQSMAEKHGTRILLPVDVVVEAEDGTVRTVAVEAVQPTDCIFDIGPATVKLFAEAVAAIDTVLWNGPVGRFEVKPYDEGTVALAHLLAESSAYTVVGGGDTIHAVTEAGVVNKMGYISTGGGAFLAYCENPALPVLQRIQQATEAVGS